MGQNPSSESDHPSQTSSEEDVQDSPYDDQNNESMDSRDPRDEDDEEDVNESAFGSSPPPLRLTELVKPIVQERDEPQKLQTAGKGELVPIQFKWNHGGEDVYVTGSFNDWQGKWKMKQNEAGEFTLLVHMQAGIHQYKFIVDEEWNVNPDEQTIEDQGVTNNIIEVKRPVFVVEDASLQRVDSDDEVEYDDEGKKLTYGQKVRVVEGKVPRMPPHLKHPVLDAPPPAPPGDRYELPLPEYVCLNHLYLYDTETTDSEVLVTAITQRFKTKPFASLKSKFVTTIYYAPKPTVDITKEKS